MMMPKESKSANIGAHRSSSRHLVQTKIQFSSNHHHHHHKRSGGLALLLLSISNIFLLIFITMIEPVSSFVLPCSHTCTTVTTDESLSPPVVSISSSQSLTTAATTATIQCWMSTSSSSTPEVSGTEAQPEATKEVTTGKNNTKSSETRKILERAKALIAVSRAKIEAQEHEEAVLLLLEDKNNEDDNTDDKSSKKSNVPFFASSSTNSDIDNNNVKKTEKVIKNKNEDTGLFTTDGDLMAKLSEEEEWETRSLLEVVEKTVKSKNVDRDIAKSIYNLRKSLQTSDFTKIFDKRNRFIGDP